MTTRGGMVLWCCVALVLVRVAVVGIALGQDATDGGHQRVLPGDVRRFHRIASLRGTPYADFAVEYPPITLAAIDALDGRTVRDTTVHVMWSQVALDAVVALLLAWGWGRRAALMYLLLGLRSSGTRSCTCASTSSPLCSPSADSRWRAGAR